MSPRVKICGLTNTADVEWAVACGADAIGLVMASSPRRVDVDDVPDLLRAAGHDVIKVAVFRSLAAIDSRRLADLGFDAVQGVGRAAGSLAVLPVIPDGPGLMTRAPAVVIDDPVAEAHAFDRLGQPQILLDGPGGGGAGVTVNPDRARRLARRYRMVLAGGLSPDNLASMVEAVSPVAVDVSSGIESGPGRKDRRLVKAFIDAARTTALSTKAIS